MRPRRTIGRRFLATSPLFLTLLACLVLLSPNVVADGSNFANVYHNPEEPFAGQTVKVSAELQNDTNVSKTTVQFCTVDPETLEVITCYIEDMEDQRNRTFVYNITTVFDSGTMIGYRIIVQYVNESLEYAPGEHEYYYYNYTGASIPPKPPTIPTELIIAEVLLGVCIGALVGFLIYRRIKKVKTGTDKILVVGIVVFLVIGILYAALSLSGISATIEKVEHFSLTDIDGGPWNLSDHSGNVVVLDFMATSCAPCEVLRQSLERAITDFEEDQLEIISVAVGPDTDAVLRQYRDDREVNWTIARDTADLVTTFGVSHLPKLVIIDKDGYATYETFEDPGSDKLKSEVNAALRGTAQPISIQQVSIFATAAFMGIATYFSPCSFPMLPGYISFYLSTEAEQKKKSSKTILASGLISGIGIILVFLIIGLVAISLGTAANLGQYMIYMGPIVGIILIVLGALMFTNLQYHALIRPFQKLKAKLVGEKTVEEGSKTGYYTKLFTYGVGYGAAASACTAPLFLALLLTGLVTGTLLDGLVILLIFSVTIILLMMAITLMLSAFGQESVQKLSAHTDTIKKISGLVLILVGAYLLYYYVTTFLLES